MRCVAFQKEKYDIFIKKYSVLCEMLEFFGFCGIRLKNKSTRKIFDFEIKVSGFCFR